MDMNCNHYRSCRNRGSRHYRRCGPWICSAQKFKVEVDEKEAAVREELPGNNCGGCGYRGL